MSGITDIIKGLYILAVFYNLKVEMATGSRAGFSYLCDLLTSLYCFPFFYKKFAAVSVHSFKTVVVLNLYVVAEASAVRRRYLYNTALCRINSGAA